MFETLLSPSEIKLYGREVRLLHFVNFSIAAKTATDVTGAVTTYINTPPPPAPSAATPAGVVTVIQKYIGNLTDPDQFFIAKLLLDVATKAVANPPPTPPGQNPLTPAQVAQFVAAAVSAMAGTPDFTNSGLGANLFLQNQLAATGARLARVYGFSYEGHYYDLPKPAIFLVHGDGDAVVGDPRSDLNTAGVMAREWEFNAANKIANDVRRWSYDKGDFSIRMDIETGQFEQILLAAITRGGTGLTSGSDLRTSGSDLRISGSDLRIKR
jgi:hypothetical protein